MALMNANNTFRINLKTQQPSWVDADLSETCLRFDWLLSIVNFEAHLKQLERVSIFSKYLGNFRVKKELFVPTVSIGILKKVKET